MGDEGGIAASHGTGGVEQHRQQVFLDVADFRGVDADAVHLPSGVVPATQAVDGVAQVFQKVRQICPLGGLHLLVCERKGCILFREVVHLLLLAKRKEAPGVSRLFGMLWGLLICCSVVVASHSSLRAPHGGFAILLWLGVAALRLRDIPRLAVPLPPEPPRSVPARIPAGSASGQCGDQARLFSGLADLDVEGSGDLGTLW